MNTDAVLRILIGALGLMPTTFFLMQTLKWRGTITKVLILQIIFNILSCSAKEYMNSLSDQEVIGITSWDTDGDLSEWHLSRALAIP